MFFDTPCVICERPLGPVCTPCEAGLQSQPYQNVTVPGLAMCRSRFVLDDRTRTIVAAMKYRGQHSIARWFAGAAAPLVPRLAHAITWMPATPERRRQRGFDQAELLAQSLAAHTGVPCVRLLQRAPNDVRQTGQSRTDRLRGPTVRATGLSSSFVVLVDDVITTGSSLRSAAAALRHGGADRVAGVVVAATPRTRSSSFDRLLPTRPR